jgi:hypothetical protein
MILPVQNPESPYVTLKIDQGEGFSFAIDDVDAFQSDIKLMNIWGEDAAEQMKQRIDKNLLISIAAAGAVAGGQAATTISGYDANYGPSLSEFTAAKGALVNGATTSRGTTVSLGTSAASVSANTGDEIVAQVLKYGRYLDENNAPEEGRFVILPIWAGSVLKSMTNNNFGLAYATGQNTANALAGTIPKIDRFEIHFSNNLPASTEAVTDASSVIFGCKYATTFASQMEKSRIIENPFSMGQMMQAIQIYGFNVIKPQLIGVDFFKNA